MNGLLLVGFCALQASFIWARFAVFRIDGTTPPGARLIEMSTLLCLAVGIVLIFRRGALHPYPPLLDGLALLACAASAAIFAWAVRSVRRKQLTAAFSADPPAELLRSGAFALVRNPFYLSYITARDVARQWVRPGSARLLRRGSDLTMVAWGNTVALCEQVAKTLTDAGRSADVIDLRCLAPWDADSVKQSAARTRRLLVVHEDNRTAGFGAEVIATVVETADGAITCRRVARDDGFVPCHFGLQLDALPSYRRTLEAAADLLALDVHWQPQPEERADRRVVHTMGSSPADQTVELAELAVVLGQDVAAGDIVASVEADKAVFDIAAPADGTVYELHLVVGARAQVGAPLLTLAVATSWLPQPTAERIDAVRLTPRQEAAPVQLAAAAEDLRHHSPSVVTLQGLASVKGRGQLHNDALAPLMPSLHAGPGEASCSAAASNRAASLLKSKTQSNGSGRRPAGPARGRHHRRRTVTGDLQHQHANCAFSIHGLPGDAPRGAAARAVASDVSAACSGWLYALGQAWDFLQQRPDAQVLVLTSETMRRVVDLHDPQTSPIFGDAATATVLTAAPAAGAGLATLRRPVLGARADGQQALQVPLPAPGAYVRMDGKRVFAEAVRTMGESLAAAVAEAGLTVDQLDLVVPHQANGRILDAVRARLRLPEHRVWNGLRFTGNTSSSSIPLALDTVLRLGTAGRRIGLCAFGAGYTFGAAVLTQAADVRFPPSASSV